MRVIRLACLVVTTVLLGCGGGGGDDGGPTDPPPPPPPPPSTQTLGSISTNVSVVNLGAGNTQNITVSAFDTNNGVIANPGSPSFTSSNAAIAEVDIQGAVLAVSQGAATINVSLTRGAVTKTAVVTVNVTGVLPGAASVSTTSGEVFTPAKVLISQGGSVSWTFGITEHTVAFQGAAGAPAGISAGGYSTTVSRTFAQPGNFNYVCTIHPQMSGQVVVR